jgi:hypothetical protein
MSKLNKREEEVLKKRCLTLNAELSAELQLRKEARTKVAIIQQQLNTVKSWLR